MSNEYAGESLAKKVARVRLLQQVAEILDVSKGTLAAWRAHRTMGTYGKVG